MGRSLQVARIDGIPVSVHVTWPLVFAAIAWSLASSYLPARFDGWDTFTLWVVALGGSAMLFLSVLAHELAHGLAARRAGIGVEGIDLFIFGGVARLSHEPERPSAEFVMAAAGPACSLAIAGLGAGLFALGQAVGTPPSLGVLLEYLVLTNLALGIFNLAPGFPLDGGRMLRAAVWAWRSDRRLATGFAAALGQVVGAGLVVWGGIQGAQAFIGHHAIGASISGVWLVLTGWFLIEAAGSAYRTTIQQETTGRLRLADVTVGPEVPFIPADLSIEALVRDHILVRDFAHYPVVEAGALIGMVGAEQVASVARERWRETPVRSLLAPIIAGQLASPGDRAADTLRRMVQDGLNRLLVVDRGRVVGVVTRQQLSAALGQD